MCVLPQYAHVATRIVNDAPWKGTCKWLRRLVLRESCLWHEPDPVTYQAHGNEPGLCVCLFMCCVICRHVHEVNATMTALVMFVSRLTVTVRESVCLLNLAGYI